MSHLPNPELRARSPNCALLSLRTEHGGVGELRNTCNVQDAFEDTTRLFVECTLDQTLR